MKTQVTSAIEIPPNKAIAAGGGSSVAGAAVAVLLWALGAQPPVEVIVSMTTLANVVGAVAVTYFTPHGAIVKE